MGVTLPPHLRRHPRYVDGCFGCKVLSLHISPAAMPAHTEGNGDYAFQRRFNRENEVDMPAYARLRRQGLQPPHIAGSAALERHAAEPWEVQMGRVYQGEERKAYRNLLSAAEGEGANLLEPATTPWTGD